MSSKTLSTSFLDMPEQRPVEVDVLPAGQVLLEAGAQLEQPGQLAPDHHFARGRLQHAADALEQGRLARAVAAQDADRLALADLRATTSLRAQKSSCGRAAAVDEPLLERVVACPWASRKRLETSLTSTATSLIAYSSSAKLPSSRPKTARATRKSDDGRWPAHPGRARGTRGYPWAGST